MPPAPSSEKAIEKKAIENKESERKKKKPSHIRPPPVDRRDFSSRWGWDSVEKAIEKKESAKEGNVGILPPRVDRRDAEASVDTWPPRVNRRVWPSRVNRRADSSRWGWDAVEKAVEKKDGKREKGE